MVRVKEILNIITYLCVLAGFASVIEYLGTYHTAGFVLLLALAGYLDYKRWVQLPRWLLNMVSLLVLVLSSLRISSDFLIEPILDALIILIAIKLVEEKKFRDYMQIYAICMFLLTGSSLISLSPIFLVYFLVLVVFTTVSLVLLAYVSQDEQMVISRRNLNRIGISALLICTVSIPGSAVLFLILPRTNYPILSFLNQFGLSRSGFSDSVRLGDVASIQEDSSAIFRVEMQQVPESRLFWRGVVMDRFDGTSWHSTSEVQEIQGASLQGEKVKQLIYLEPYGHKYLFALDRPEFISLARKRSRKSMTFALPGHIHERLRYTAVSILTDFQPEDLADPQPYLQVPREFSPEIRKLVQVLTEGKYNGERIGAILRFLQAPDFKYSIEDLPVSGAPLDDFLLNSKRGNCEYFASAMAVMLRLGGIPSRLVGGYRGGYYNNTGAYYLVLQKNAHVWVEAHVADFKGKTGWLRIDPTPFSEDMPYIRYGESILLQLKLLLDTFNYYWNKQIIGYDFSKQLMVLNQIKSSFKKPDLRFSLKGVTAYKNIFAGASVAIVVLTLLGWLVWKSRGEPHEKLLAQFLKRMSLLGYPKRSGEGLEELVARVENKELQSTAEAFVREFQEIFYRDRRFDRQHLERLGAQVRRLRDIA